MVCSSRNRSEFFSRENMGLPPRAMPGLCDFTGRRLPGTDDFNLQRRQGVKV